jgi:hypothetical protein
MVVVAASGLEQMAVDHAAVMRGLEGKYIAALEQVRTLLCGAVPSVVTKYVCGSCRLSLSSLTPLSMTGETVASVPGPAGSN